MTAIVGAPLVEEVALRLFVMSAIGWVVSRFTSRGNIVFALAPLVF